MNRRQFLCHSSLITSAVLLRPARAWSAESTFPIVRVPESKRKFKSPAVERTIERIRSMVGNRELAWMFENCFPNTLDTTVDFEVVDGRTLT